LVNKLFVASSLDSFLKRTCRHEYHSPQATLSSRLTAHGSHKLDLKHNVGIKIPVFLLLAALAATSVAEPHPKTLSTLMDDSRVHSQIEAIESLGTVEGLIWGDHGTILQIKGALDLQAIFDSEPQERALQTSKLLGPSLGFNGMESLSNPQIRHGNSGARAIRFDQKIDGLPVRGAFVTIREKPESGYMRIISKSLLDDGLSRTPRISPEAANEIALGVGDDEDPLSVVNTPRLVYTMKAPGQNRGALAWEVDLANRKAPFSGKAKLVTLDANDGSLVHARTQNFRSLSRDVYDSLGDDDLDHNSLVLNESGSSFNAHANAIFENSGITYQYFADNFSHDPFLIEDYSSSGCDFCPSSKSNIVSFFNTNPPVNGAYFNPAFGVFLYGDGDLSAGWGPTGKSLHVVAHELVHALTTNRFSGNEGAALNEAYSDVLAAAVYADDRGDGPTVWKIAHESYEPTSSSTALRYIDDPKKKNDPPHSDDFNDLLAWSHANSTWGNSTVVSLAFYLLSEGGTHPRSEVSNINVSGIGIDNAADIFFTALFDTFDGSVSSFSEARWWLELAAKDIFGESERDSVSAAFDVVNVPDLSQVNPDTPESISADSSFCYGFHHTSWDAVLGASSYIVRYSSDQDFTNGQTKYSGSRTVTGIDIPDDEYLGVKACNDSGCSGYKNTVKLFRQSMCM